VVQQQQVSRNLKVCNQLVFAVVLATASSANKSKMVPAGRKQQKLAFCSGGQHQQKGSGAGLEFEIN